jgi:mannosylglycerate hydrolase
VRVEAILVTHSHWDREWYRTFQDFRARLVDLVDRVIELCDADPGYRFLLDGQTVVIEDYLEIRPGRAEALRALCAAGRIALGPWYVQPDSLLPSGEAHVRNLLIGREVGEALGPVSRVGYTPDSFGHPAQLPQILAGFGIGSFVYWRGNGAEIDALPAEYDWLAPDGSRVLACHLGKGYFSAATPPRADPATRAEAVRAIAQRAKELAERSRSGVVLLLNGIDHAMPEARSGDLAEQLAQATGFPVRRGLLEEFVERAAAGSEGRPRFAGELVGGRVAPLLPGVWSTRSWIKLANRRAEACLEGHAEPLAALALAFGLPDESPALRLAWKELLKNQAHDSICGCSRDEVHEQMRARFDAAEELGRETARRCAERLAGLGTERAAPWSDAFDLVVTNPSPRRRSGVVRFPLDFHPYLIPHPNPARGIHPTLLGDLRDMGFTVDGEPARLVPAETGRLKLLPDRGAFDLEFVARDVPALGLRRVRVRRATDAMATADAASAVVPGAADAHVAAGDCEVWLREDGCFDARLGERRFRGLGALESCGDRGDSYDFDPVTAGPGLALEGVSAERRIHPGGIQELRVVRRLRLPARLAEGRRVRADETAPLELETRLRVAPGVPRIDLELRVENAARDHRLRMLFPVGDAVRDFEAATTFDVARRTPGAADDSGWVQRAPATFPQQGFVHAGGLGVIAPGLPEAEVTPGSADEPACVAITLLRCVGSLSRHDLASRPGPAGPGSDTPGAQCPGTLRARLCLTGGADPVTAREAELPLRAFACGEETLAPEGRALLALEPEGLLLSAFKPAEHAGALIVRVLNPSDAALRARVTPGFPFASVASVRLDETPDGQRVTREGAALHFDAPPHALRTLLLTLG